MELSAINFWTIFLIAIAITAGMSPVSILLARKTGAIDVPRDDRRMHKRPIPRIGGLAIFCGSAIGIILAVELGYCDLPEENISHMKIYSVLIGGALMFLLGLIDDYKNLKPIVKLAGQISIATVVYFLGIKLSFISVFLGETQFTGVASYIFTVLWLVGITNTINLVDGLDGLAAGIVAIASICIAYVCYIFGYYASCIPVLALAGGCFGFLPFNFYPAKTFMGDCGSLYLGFMIAAFSLLQPVKSTTMVAVIVPSLVLALPLFDTIFAIIRRLVNHKPLMVADKGHIHHRLMKTGMGQRRTVLCMYGVCGIMGIAAILVSRELYKETLGLCFIALMYIYIVLTDPNRNSAHPHKREGKKSSQKTS